MSAKLVKLNTPNGPLFVNPAHVAAILPASSGNSVAIGKCAIIMHAVPTGLQVDHSPSTAAAIINGDEAAGTDPPPRNFKLN